MDRGGRVHGTGSAASLVWEFDMRWFVKIGGLVLVMMSTLPQQPAAAAGVRATAAGPSSVRGVGFRDEVRVARVTRTRVTRLRTTRSTRVARVASRPAGIMRLSGTVVPRVVQVDAFSDPRPFSSDAKINAFWLDRLREGNSRP
jgi:hypothetical protein